MKVEGKPTDKHPVIYKLAHIRKLFDTLAPVNDKIMKAVEVLAQPVKQTNKTQEPHLISEDEAIQSEKEDDGYGSYGSQDDQEGELDED